MKRSTAAIIFSFFLCSGAISLVYQSLWIRILSLGVGSTSASMSIVLALFFLGLSLGSFLSGKYNHRFSNPLLVYGILETVLGITALLIIYPLFTLQSVVGVIPLEGTWSFVGPLLKYLVVALLLFVPTTIMGATLPLLVRLFSGSAASFGRSVSLLYAINTFGAVAGAFSTGYFLIPQIGIEYSNNVAALFNVILGLSAVLVAKKERAIVETQAVSEDISLFSFKNLSALQKTVLFSSFVTGFVSISAEVIWNKYLNIFFGTNIYGIGLVLSLFLTGIAVGSLALSFFIDRIQSKEKFYWTLFAFVGVSCLVSSYLLNEAPRFALVLESLAQGKVSFLFIKSLVIGLILIVPTCCFGALFPLGVCLLKRENEDASYTVGLFYGINTLGAILGSYFTGILFVPHFGSSITMQGLILALVVSAWVILKNSGEITPSLKRLGMISLVALGGSVLFFGRIDFKNLIKTAYHQGGYQTASRLTPEEWLKKHLEPLERDYEEFKLIIEGETAVISLSHDPMDGEQYRKYLRLKTSGLNESVYQLENLEELPKYEALIGFLPYLFSRAPKTAFIVGYGGGFTVDLLTSTDLQRVNVVELEEGILKAAGYVYKGNNPILKRPNLNLKVEDARFILASRQWGKQDIIVSQPSHSWLTGAANLFTKEFFEIVRGSLSERGIFSQWLNLYNMDVDVLRSILRTFYEVFPNGAVFTQGGDQELVLIGSNRPLELNLEKLELLRKNRNLEKKLTQVFRSSSFDLLSLFTLSRDQVIELTKSASLNTDRNAFAEVAQSRLFYDGLQGRETPQHYLASVFNGDYSAILKNEPSDFYYNLALNLSDTGENRKMGVVLSQYEKSAKQDPATLWKLGFLCYKAERYVSAEKYLSRALRNLKDVSLLNSYLNVLLSLGKMNEMQATLKKYSSLRDALTECLEADTLLSLQKEGADTLFAKLVADVPGFTRECGSYYNKIVGRFFLEKGKPEVSVPFLESYYASHPTDISNLETMLSAYEKLKDESNYSQFSEYLPRVRDEEQKRLQKLAGKLKEAGYAEDAAFFDRRLEEVRKVSLVKE